jgi:hypothetical protein
MGQALSAAGSETLAASHGAAVGWPAPGEQSLPLVLSNVVQTTVLELGNIDSNGPCYWFVEGGRRRLPLPIGFKASALIYGTPAHIEIRKDPRNASALQFVVKLQDNAEEYSGNSPTAPFAKLALAHKRLDCINGFDAFGFSDIRVQAMLRGIGQATGLLDHPVLHATTDVPVGPWAQRTRPPETLVDALKRGIAAQQHQQQRQRQRQQQQVKAQYQPRMLGPEASLHTWLDRHTPTKEQPVQPSTTPFATAPQPYFPMETDGRFQQGVPAGAAPQRKPSAFGPLRTVSGGVELDPGAHAAALTTRPPSRSRRPSSSEGRSGRGWTAFTAFGLEERDRVRTAHPHATPTEVEKLVGQRWAALTAAEKQHYVEVAQEARRTSQGGAPGRQESLPDAEALKRTRSDAGTPGTIEYTTEERQLRPKRRSKYTHFGTEFETGDVDAAAGAGARRELLGRPPLPPRSRGGGEFAGSGKAFDAMIEGAPGSLHVRTMPGMRQEERRGRGRGRGGQSQRQKKARPSTQPGTVPESPVGARVDEADVLGLLATMRAEVIASDSSQEMGGEGEEAAPQLHGDEEQGEAHAAGGDGERVSAAGGGVEVDESVARGEVERRDALSGHLGGGDVVEVAPGLELKDEVVEGEMQGESGREY